jgi:glycosyltransferase 2 family protein
MTPRKAKALKFAVKAIVSSALLGFIFYSISWAKFVSILGRVDVLFVALTVGFNAAGVFLSAMKWQCLLDIKGIQKTVRQLHAFYYMGFFFNNFLPSMIGGDLFRILKTCSTPKHKADAICGVLAERGIGLLTMLVLTAIAAFWNTWRSNVASLGLPWLEISGLTSIALLLLLGILLASLSPHLRRLMHRYRSFRSVLQIRDTLSDYLNYPQVLIKAFVLSGIFHILLILNGWLFVRSVGLNLDPIVLAVVFPVTMLLAMIPLSLNGFGIKEGALIVLLGQLGVAPEEGLVVAGLSRLFIVLASVAGGILFLIDRTPNGLLATSEAGLSRITRKFGIKT